MSLWDNKAAFCRFLDSGLNNGDLDAVQSVIHPDFIGYVSGRAAPLIGHEDCKNWVLETRGNFPDLNTYIEGNWLIGETGRHEIGKDATAERVAALVVLRGSPATASAEVSRPVVWCQVHLLTFEGGRIKQDIIINDTLSLLLQMGTVQADIIKATPFMPPELV